MSAVAVSDLGSLKTFSDTCAVAVFTISCVSGFFGENAFSKVRVDV